MKNKLSMSLVKVFVLLAAVVAMVLSIPSSVIPSTMIDVNINNQTGNNTSSNNKQDALTNSVLLDDTNENGNSINNLLGETNNTLDDLLNKDNQSSNSNGSQGTSSGSSSGGNDDNLLLDDNFHLNQVPGDLTESTADTTLRYFDVTLFNYDTTAINNATKENETNDLKFFEGIYFRNKTSLTDETVRYGYYSPSYDSASNATVESGKYLIISERGNHYLTGTTSSITGVTTETSGMVWTITKKSDGTYTIQDEAGKYLQIGNGVSETKLSTSSQTLSFYRYNSDNLKIQIKQGDYYLNQNGTTANYGGYGTNNDAGNAMFLVKVDYYTPSFDSNGNATIEDGYYYIVNNQSAEYLKGTTSSITAATSRNDAIVWHISGNSSSGYTVQATTGNYLSMSRSWTSTSVNLSSSSTTFNIKKFTGTSAAANPDNAITFSKSLSGILGGTNTYYLYDSSTSNTNYGATTTATNAGNAMYLIKLEETLAPQDYTPTISNGKAVLEDGQYYIVNKRATSNFGTNHYLVGDNDSIDSVTSTNNAVWTIKTSGNGYTIQNKDGLYMTFGAGASTSYVTSTKTEVNIVSFSGDSSAVQLNIGGQYLNQHGGKASKVYGGYGQSNDAGNAMYLKKAVSKYDISVSYGSRSIGYAPWNKWTGNQVSVGDNGQSLSKEEKNSYAGFTYNSLVKNTLDANGNIQFNFAEGGIFDTTDTSTKSVYKNVGLPFLYTNGLYSFDALADSARFVGGAASDKKLTWNDQPQKYTENFDSTEMDAGFFPFDDKGIIDRNTNPTYHFGMKAELDFYMTPDGKSIIDGSDIEFYFAGDDDVWVFIDGKLVLDMGGIHDSVDGNINFADNATVVRATKVNEQRSGYFDANNGEPYDSNGKIIKTQTAGIGEAPDPIKLFNDSEGEGILGKTREEFSNENVHTLTLYYLERGSSESNFELGFNLPINDTVNVTKNITHSKTSSGAVSKLTAAEQAMVDNLDYTFVLYRDGVPVSNYTYKLFDKNLTLLTVGTTDANGEFTIKNTQIASFVEEIGTGDMSHRYYVVEKQLEGFETPDSKMEYTGTGKASLLTQGTGWQSPEYRIDGLLTHMDSALFTFTNYLKSDIPNPSVFTNIDQYVLDFGITANLGNVLSNDVYKGDSIELTSVYSPANGNSTSAGQYGTFSWDANGNVTYKLNKQLTKPEVLKYTVTVSTDGEDPVTGTGTIYIMPATSIYYEEDFIGLVTFKVANGVNPWVQVGTTNGNIQESGLVGNTQDSPYGSDASYLDDSGDSNGTSYYVNTTNGAAQFTYTFTGTGTSFFARTTNTTGTMRVRIKDKDGKVIYELMRDTSYKTDDNDTTLYNIPVFTYHADTYGTYTVEATIAKLTVSNNGTVIKQPEFYLDGITIFNPLDKSFNSKEEQDLVILNESAYASDSEANNTVVTLRDKIITDYIDDSGQNWNTDKFVIFTDTDGNILLGGDGSEGSDEANIYISNGPKEEVYMVDGQQMKFALKGLDTSTHKVYLGLKAPTGHAKVLINGNEVSIDNSKECYYDITNYVTLVEESAGVYVPVFVIEADAADKTGACDLGLISVTNIRVTGNVEFAIAPDVNK